MQKLKEYKYIILIALLVLGFAFYWYSWRPSQIIKKCTNSKNLMGYSIMTPELLYKNCLRVNGLEK